MKISFNWMPILALLAVGCNSAPSQDASASSGSASTSSSTPALQTQQASGAVSGVATLKELKITDTKPGKGDAAAPGDLLVMLYKGTLHGGTKAEFDANMDGSKPPFSFILGAGNVIEGWDKGMVGLKVGGKRTLEIPAAMAYGAEGRPPAIPGNSDLKFEVELLYVVKKGAEGDYDAKDTKPGSGPAAKTGDKVKVHYTGMFLNGKKFDSSVDRGQPFEFTLGRGEVIKGWDAGVVGMRPGGKRTLIIPPAIAYGEDGQGQDIPPNSVLKFEIELLEIVK